MREIVRKTNNEIIDRSQKRGCHMRRRRRRRRARRKPPSKDQYDARLMSPGLGHKRPRIRTASPHDDMSFGRQARALHHKNKKIKIIIIIKEHNIFLCAHISQYTLSVAIKLECDIITLLRGKFTSCMRADWQPSVRAHCRIFAFKGRGLMAALAVRTLPAGRQMAPAGRRQLCTETSSDKCLRAHSTHIENR